MGTPEDFIPPVLERVKREYLCRMYKLTGWTDPNDFIDQVSKRTGKLLKGGEPDTNAVSKMILNDWQRGKLPFFVAPPVPEELKQAREAAAAEVETNEKKKFEPKLAQDFSKIRVDLHYEGDDVQPLEEQNLDGENPSEDEGNEQDVDDVETLVQEAPVQESSEVVTETTSEGEKQMADDEDEDWRRRRKRRWHRKTQRQKIEAQISNHHQKWCFYGHTSFEQTEEIRRR